MADLNTAIETVIINVETLVQLSSLDATLDASKLLAIDAQISELEQQTATLEDMLADEERAVTAMETLSKRAVEHNQALDGILEQNVENVEPQRVDKPAAIRTQALQQQQQQPITTPPTSFRRVSRQELEAIPRTVRGRIGLSVVNEALEDIQAVCRAKLAKNRCKIRREMFVTEQELRQACAFFCSGESTARTTLSILRHANRIKQVPCKDGNVVYVVSLQPKSSSN
jgi:hypothetical protein